MPLPKTPPAGFGVWLWQIKNSEGGDVKKIVKRYRDCGVSWCLIKTGDTEPGWPKNKMYQGWQDEAEAIRDAGIPVYAWAYVSTIAPKEEADMLLESLHQRDSRGRELVSGLTLDPESEQEMDGGHTPQMEEMLSRVRAAEPEVFIGFAGWPILSAHGRYPIVPLLKYCDMAMDQDYWQYQGVEPEWCLERAEVEFRKAKARVPGSKCMRSPAIPIHDVTGAQIERALADKSIGPCPSGWVHQYAKQEQWDAVRNHAQGKQAPSPPPIVRVKELQVFLNGRGFDCGAPDGVIGARTTQAIATYQRSKGMPRTGKPDKVTLAAMRAELGWRP
jgi:hypothetical protein